MPDYRLRQELTIKYFENRTNRSEDKAEKLTTSKGGRFGKIGNYLGSFIFDFKYLHCNVSVTSAGTVIRCKTYITACICASRYFMTVL